MRILVWSGIPLPGADAEDVEADIGERLGCAKIGREGPPPCSRSRIGEVQEAARDR